jgi:lipopolysaccharide/colanic/teichoic acid biosynthesis glycosyltransferase
MNDLSRVDELVGVIPDMGASLRSPVPANDARVALRRGGISLQSGLPMRIPTGGGGVQHSARRLRHLRAKRVFDAVASAAALLALMPLLVLTALLVKVTSSGPVFFRQEREGFQGRPFMALKFRSMRIDDCDITGVAQTVKNDPRVTVVGSFLRRTSIDELPQLINVLRGDMSLVGPRPHVSGMRAGGTSYDQLVPYYYARLEMLPGLTGWAQANGLRGPTDRADKARARIDHDIAYIQNFSFWLDIKIILLTLRHEFLGGSGH